MKLESGHRPDQVASERLGYDTAFYSRDNGKPLEESFKGVLLSNLLIII